MEFFNAFTPSIGSLYVSKYLPHFQPQESLAKRFSVLIINFFAFTKIEFFKGTVDLTRTEN